MAKAELSAKEKNSRSQDRVKIVFIITGLAGGGAEGMLLKLLRNLDRKVFSPEVVSLSTRGAIGPIIEDLGIPVHAIGLRSGRFNPARFLALVQLLRALKPSVVQTWMYHADLIGGLAARLAGVQNLAWGIRHSDLSPANNKRATLIVVHLCALLSGWLPRRILTCSERALADHVRAGYRPEKMVLIRNGFDLADFKPDAKARDFVRTELGIPFGAPLVGMIGRNDPQKNHLGFVEAAAQVRATIPQVNFILAGSGIDRKNKALVRALRELKLEDCFHLLGRREDVSRLMASLDVLVSSSHGEAFSNVIGEAMACAVPCVVTDVGDSAYIVANTGRVAPPNNMDRLACHLIEVLNMPPAERAGLGRLARDRVRIEFAIGDVTRKYEDFYFKLSGSA